MGNDVLVTFRVNRNALFDALKSTNGDCTAIGIRIVTVMMEGEGHRVGVVDAMAMSHHGISVDNIVSVKK